MVYNSVFLHQRVFVISYQRFFSKADTIGLWGFDKKGVFRGERGHFFIVLPLAPHN